MFKKKLVILCLVSFIMLLSLVIASIVYTGKLNDNNQFFLTEVEPRNNALTAMLSSFGYGHAIHNFKNLVLRGADPLERQQKYEQLLFNKRQFYFALYNYVALVNQNTLSQYAFSTHATELVEAERGALKQIKLVFDQYMTAAKQVSDRYASEQSADSIKSPMTIEAIDKHHKIDDRPATQGMKQLQTGISRLRSEVLNNSKELVQTLNLLIIFASVILAVFIFTAIMFAFQLLRPIRNLHGLIDRTGDTFTAIEQFNHPHQDEFGLLLNKLKQATPP